MNEVYIIVKCDRSWCVHSTACWWDGRRVSLWISQQHWRHRSVCSTSWPLAGDHYYTVLDYWRHSTPRHLVAELLLSTSTGSCSVIRLCLFVHMYSPGGIIYRGLALPWCGGLAAMTDRRLCLPYTHHNVIPSISKQDTISLQYGRHRRQ